VKEDVYSVVPQRLNDMAKVRLPEPKYPAVDCHILR